MRYWAYFGAKLVVAGGVLYGLLLLLSRMLPARPRSTSTTPFRNGPLRLLYNLAFMAGFCCAPGSST